MNKTRILHILYSFDPGGIESGIASLINHMPPGEFEHSICVFSQKLGALEKIAPDRKPEIFVCKRFFRNDPSLVFRVMHLIGKKRPDIVATYNWGGMEGTLAALLCRVKGVVHAEHGFNLDELTGPKKRRILVRKYLLPRCGKIVSASKNLRNWLVGTVGLDANKVLHIPNGCDLKLFYPGKDLQKRKELGIGENDTVVGTVGSLKELKNPSALLRVFSEIIPSNPRLKLLFVGDGPQKKELIATAAQRGVSERLIITGNATDPAPYYRAMDIFVLPSLSEQSPSVIAEAMASGLPVVATDVGDVREMLGGDEGGIVIAPRDDQGMAQGIRRFLREPDLAAKKAKFARRRAEGLFGIDRMINSYLSLYREVLTRNPRGQV